MSGIGAVMAYSMHMLQDAGLDMMTAKYATVGIGLCNFLSPTITIALVDRAGRKILLFVGYGICFVCLCTMTLLIQGKDYWNWNPQVALG